MNVRRIDNERSTCPFMSSKEIGSRLAAMSARLDVLEASAADVRNQLDALNQRTRDAKRTADPNDGRGSTIPRKNPAKPTSLALRKKSHVLTLFILTSRFLASKPFGKAI